MQDCFPNQSPDKVRPCTRVLTCKGNIQLLTGFNALKSREEEMVGRVFRDYLVIYDLYAPEGRNRDFFEAIRDLAGTLQDWQDIIFIPPDLLQEWLSNYDYKGLLQHLGIAETDELYLERNWQNGNRFIMQAFPSAFKICYGDSIGIYFPADYFDENSCPTPKSKPNGLLSELKMFFSFRKQNTLKAPDDFDRGYFLLPEFAGVKPDMPVYTPSMERLARLFEIASGNLSPEIIHDLSRQIRGKETYILMTSNFSEAGKMSVQAEINAYREFILQHLHSNRTKCNLLLIKPHPRDSQAKIEALQGAFNDLFDEVIALTQPEFYYLLFESLFLKIFHENGASAEDFPIILTFSTACLSLALLYGRETYIGFGETLVNQYFAPEYRIKRIGHEKDLKRVTGLL